MTTAVKSYTRSLSVSTLVGDDVVNARGEKLGNLKEIMIDVERGQVSYAVLAFGGFLGFGEKLHAIPWQAFSVDETNQRLVLNVDRETLERAEGFDPDNWPDMADEDWARGVHEHYGYSYAPYRSEETVHERRGAHGDSAVRTTGRKAARAGDEQTFEVVEEELQVGKRQVERGGVRVGTHVTETPVEEEVHLREERVNVERRPVDRPATEADLNALRDETIEITAKAEEAVVNKRARVIEEVVVSKDASERTETVRDTVRRTDVDVEDLGTGRRDFESYDADFRRDYETSFADRGYSYEQYAPAYRYGHDLAAHDHYQGRDWSEIEPEVRRDWEARNPGTWQDFKDAVRQGWERVTGRA